MVFFRAHIQTGKTAFHAVLHAVLHAESGPQANHPRSTDDTAPSKEGRLGVAFSHVGQSVEVRTAQPCAHHSDVETKLSMGRVDGTGGRAPLIRDRWPEPSGKDDTTATDHQAVGPSSSAKTRSAVAPVRSYRRTSARTSCHHRHCRRRRAGRRREHTLWLGIGTPGASSPRASTSPRII